MEVNIKIVGSLLLKETEGKTLTIIASTPNHGVAQIDAYFIDNKEDYGETGLFISRLIVPKKLRNQGIATKLMNALIEFLNENKMKSFLYINPYGDLNYQQLKKFYEKYGYKDKNELLVRNLI